MIISYQHKYIFVHIPKTGGTSLALALEKRVGKDDILIGDTPKAIKRKNRLKTVDSTKRLWKHSRLKDVDNDILRVPLENYFVFTITRNPWARMVSYYYWLASQKFPHPAVQLAKTLNFSDFLNHPLTLKGMQQDQIADYLKDRDGIIHQNLVLKMETLAQDCVKLERELGFKFLPLEHLNQSKKVHDYRAMYSTPDAGLVAECYRDDISELGYDFDPS